MNFGIRETIESFSDIQDFDKNPFIEELVINETNVLKRFKKGEAVIDEANTLSLEEINKLTKEHEEIQTKGLEIAQVKTRQKAEFILLYIPMFDYKNMLEISFKILFFIIERKINLGNDSVILSINECCIELKSTRPTISKGFVDLVNKKILAKKYDNVWWINPNYFYAGNRLRIKTK